MISILIYKVITACIRSLGQGNIFAPVCHSVHRGGLPQCMLGYRQLPGTRGRYPPGADTSLEQTPSPTAVHAGRYGQQAGGTHSTGMHTCWQLRLDIKFEKLQLCFAHHGSYHSNSR